MWPAGLDKHQDNPYVSLLSEALASVGVRVAEFRPSMVCHPGTRFVSGTSTGRTTCCGTSVGPGVRPGRRIPRLGTALEAAPTNGRLDDPQYWPAQRNGLPPAEAAVLRRDEVRRRDSDAQ